MIVVIAFGHCTVIMRLLPSDAVFRNSHNRLAVLLYNILILKLNLVLLSDGISYANNNSGFCMQQRGFGHMQTDQTRVWKSGTVWISSGSNSIVMNHHEMLLLRASTGFDLNPKLFLKQKNNGELNIFSRGEAKYAPHYLSAFIKRHV